MSDYTFTLAELEATVRELASEQPDYRYKPQAGASCRYVHHEPLAKLSATSSDIQLVCGCIFGHALNRLGVPLEKLVEFDDTPMIGTNIRGALKRLGIVENDYPDCDHADYEPLRWLREVQANQDCGNSWSGAVSEADQFHPLMSAESSE